jgi:enoyl-CoA hydratase
MTQRITMSASDGIVEVGLDRPPVNAFDLEQVERLAETVSTIEASREARVAVFRGSNGRFCGGADIGMIRGFLGEPDGAKQLRGFAQSLQEVFLRIERLAIPTIAAIDGAATGGGLELALACDHRIATSRSRIGLPEVKLGLLPGAGGTQRLAKVVGEATALRLVLSGTLIDGDEAARLGLVHAAVGDASAEALVLARTLGGSSRAAVAAIKRCVRMAPDGFAAELDATEELAGLPETAERVAQFFDRHKEESRD